MLALVERLERAGIALSHIDLGGGMGIRYRDEAPAPIGGVPRWRARRAGGRKETVIVDPGRSIVGNAGVLLTRVEYVKPGEAKNFVVVDAAMNDLIRPGAVRRLARDAPGARRRNQARRPVFTTSSGPVCESADFLARERKLAVAPGGLLAIMSAGAYGMVMSSNYNTRPRPAEVMVSGDRGCR